MKTLTSIFVPDHYFPFQDSLGYLLASALLILGFTYYL